MDILIACEFSGIVREAFKAKGHNAWSCDLLASDIPGQHIIGNVTNYINSTWDLMIAFPPCTHLASSGARWFHYKQKEQLEALRFVRLLLNAPIKKIALENPIGITSTYIRKPSQIIQPWQFGHGEQKATCLWLSNLPKLQPTNVVKGREQRIWKMSPSQDRSKLRSVTYFGIAQAMADQWG